MPRVSRLQLRTTAAPTQESLAHSGCPGRRWVHPPGGTWQDPVGPLCWSLRVPESWLLVGEPPVGEPSLADPYGTG